MKSKFFRRSQDQTSKYFKKVIKGRAGARMSKEQKKFILELQAEGLTLKEIADQVGVGTSTVSRFLAFRREKDESSED